MAAVVQITLTSILANVQITTKETNVRLVCSNTGVVFASLQDSGLTEMINLVFYFLLSYAIIAIENAG